MITGVAIKDINGKAWQLPKPNRHHHVIHLIYTEVGNTPEARHLLREHVQGFVNDKGIFLDRKEAFFEALQNNQILPPYNPIDPSQRRGIVNKEPRELFSEDLW